MATRNRVAFLRQSGSFLLSSYCLREAKKCPMAPIISRSRDEDDTFDEIHSRVPYERAFVRQSRISRDTRKCVCMANANSKDQAQPAEISSLSITFAILRYILQYRDTT